MKSDIYWIAGPWQGKLGTMPRPRGGDWLRDEIESWCEAGVEVVVSLLSADEEHELGLEAEARLAQTCGVTFISFPIDDYGVPASKDAVRELVHELEDLLLRGRCVGIHCRQGIGRSSLVAACLLAVTGENVDVSFQRISDARGLSVPDTLDQRNWVWDFARATNNTHVR
jgi:protein-tyrosine phosphatase